MNTQNLNNQIETLLTMLQAESDNNSSGTFSFVPSVIDSARQIQANVVLTEDELNYSASSEQKEELSEELSQFYKALRRGYEYKIGTEVPDWMKRQKTGTLASVYERIFENLSELSDDFVTWFQSDSGYNIADVREKAESYAAIVSQEEEHKIIAEKISKAVDLRAMLMGVLRLYGLSTFEIRAKLLGE